MTEKTLARTQPDETALPEAKTDVGTHVLFGLCVAVCLSFFIWASIFTLDIVSVAGGEVIPSSQVKSVQHLEGGIVLEISVEEGEVVSEGQQLVVLERTQSGADVGELQVRLLALKAEIIRLEAELADLDAPDFPEDMHRDHPKLVAQALEQFAARQNAITSRLRTNGESIIQRQQEINAIETRIKNQSRTLTLLDEQVTISDALIAEDLSNRYSHLNLLREQSELRGQLDEDRVAVKRAMAALEESRLQLEITETSFKERIARELNSARTRFDELSQRRQKYDDNLARTVLRAPVNGVIKTLYVNTVGGVLGPGEVVADLVPVGDTLIVEARLATQDIGYVAPGQSAMIRLSSADAVRFGGLEGTVTGISPDTLTTEDGLPYYKVRIETESDRFQRDTLQYRLFPGMQVMASIRTGERTVLEYLSDPFLSSMGNALGER